MSDRAVVCLEPVWIGAQRRVGVRVSVCVLVWGEGEDSSGSKKKQAGNPQANLWERWRMLSVVDLLKCKWQRDK